jgi:hypothetical protein
MEYEQARCSASSSDTEECNSLVNEEVFAGYDCGCDGGSGGSPYSCVMSGGSYSCEAIYNTVSCELDQDLSGCDTFWHSSSNNRDRTRILQ